MFADQMHCAQVIAVVRSDEMREKSLIGPADYALVRERPYITHSADPDRLRLQESFVADRGPDERDDDEAHENCGRAQVLGSSGESMLIHADSVDRSL